MNAELLPAEHAFAGALRNGYRVIYADPPWHFNCGTGKKSRHPIHHYRTMPIREITALPIKDLAHPDGARVLMWTTMPFLPQAINVLKAWGAKYSTSRVWVKTWLKNAKPPWDEYSFSCGSGYEVIGNPELLLIGKIGKPPGIAPPKPRALIIGPRREHSRKPDLQAEIERHCEGPYIELFARETRPGWTAWGLEKTKFDPIEVVA